MNDNKVTGTAEMVHTATSESNSEPTPFIVGEDDPHVNDPWPLDVKAYPCDEPVP